MPVTWLHGVETIESTSATTSVTEVKTAVIAIVGTAPKGPVNKVTIVNNAKDAAQFGTFAEYGLTSGFTIPYTINAIQAYGTGTIVVVNVFTPSETSETEKTVADENLTFAEGSATLAHPEKVSNLVLTSTDGATTYELTTDYTFDAETGALCANVTLHRTDATALPRAAAIARLAAAAFARGETLAPERLEPAYLRDKVALTLAEQGKG